MTLSFPQSARDDAIAIWRAALAAVDSERLVRQQLAIKDHGLVVGEIRLPLDDVDRIAVVGAGKAGAGMAAGVIAGLGDKLCREKQVHGWLNVPEDCVRDLSYVRLHGARPAGVNEPTQRGVDGANRILEIVAGLGPRDVCLCLLSGGGSALLPAPVPEVPLEEKLEVTRHLSAAGANIQQLNTVRKQLSRVKGGRLAQACRAGHLIVLVISDVMGDPLDIIASGPTVADPSTPQEALDVWQQLGLDSSLAPRAHRYLTELSARRPSTEPARFASQVHHQIIGNNATAVEAACQEAQRRGYRVESSVASQSEGDANEVGHRLAERALKMRDAARGRRDEPASAPGKTTPGGSEETRPADCLITGGEPTVRLVPAEERGKGGRNQQLVLAAYDFLRRRTPAGENPCEAVVLLSGGTDGEDGPTDAAGAWIDAETAASILQRNDDPASYLRRNDAYSFFQRHGALIITGPTHTNVCDVRVVLARHDTDKTPSPPHSTP